MRLGALSRIAASLEEARIIAFQDGRQPWKELLAPSQLALEVLLRPAVDLESLQPHQLIVDATACMDVLRFQEGLAQLILKTRYAVLLLRRWSRLTLSRRCSGIIARFCLRRLTRVIFNGLTRLKGQSADAFIDLLRQTLTPATIDQWWSLCATSRSHRHLLIELYNGIQYHPWTRTPVPSIRSRLIGEWQWTCIGMPMLAYMCRRYVECPKLEIPLKSFQQLKSLRVWPSASYTACSALFSAGCRKRAAL